MAKNGGQPTTGPPYHGPFAGIAAAQTRDWFYSAGRPPIIIELPAIIGIAPAGSIFVR
jgi:hypothetical protein